MAYGDSGAAGPAGGADTGAFGGGRGPDGARGGGNGRADSGRRGRRGSVRGGVGAPTAARTTGPGGHLGGIAGGGESAGDFARANKAAFAASRLGQAQQAAREDRTMSDFDRLGRSLGQVKREVVDPVTGMLKGAGIGMQVAGPLGAIVGAGLSLAMSDENPLSGLQSILGGDAPTTAAEPGRPAGEGNGGARRPTAAAQAVAATQPEAKPQTPYEAARDAAAARTRPAAETRSRGRAGASTAGSGFLAQAKVDIERARTGGLARLGAY